MKTIEDRIDEWLKAWRLDIGVHESALLREAAEELRRPRGLIREHNASFSCATRGCTCALEDER